MVLNFKVLCHIPSIAGFPKRQALGMILKVCLPTAQELKAQIHP